MGPINSVDPDLAAYLDEAVATERWFSAGASDFQAGKAILAKPAQEKAAIALGIARELDHWKRGLGNLRLLSSTDQRWRRAYFLSSLFSALIRTDLPFDGYGIGQLLNLVSSETEIAWVRPPIMAVVRTVERYARGNALNSTHRDGLERLLTTRAAGEQTVDGRKLHARIAALLSDHADSGIRVEIEAGEPWADRAIQDLARLQPDARHVWESLLSHAKSTSGSKPSGVWHKRARELIAAVGERDFLNAVDAWFPLVGRPGVGRPMRGFIGEVLNPTLISEPNADALKGLAWAVGATGNSSAARVLADLAEVCFKKIPQMGARCPRVGNACLTALCLLQSRESVGELSRLRSRVKQPSIRSSVEKAIDRSAQAMGISRDEVEEMSVPTYGLGPNGTTSRTLGDFRADLEVVGTAGVALRWTGPTGKTVKSVPAEVKRSHAQELKELQRVQKDIQKMLPAQAERIERLLLDAREWPVNVWRERYLDHPLLSQISRRLIWQFAEPAAELAIWHDDRLVRSDGTEFVPADATTVRLWHPISSPAEAVLAWRRWLDEHQVTQPFKQAHREVYILTDAERQTHTYSNRFAAHVLRQHQFAALCQSRGWKYRLMGGFDSHNTPTIELPRQGFRAEFWVEQPGNDELSPAGINLRIVTDQVRFYRMGTYAPLPLDQVPPLLFSEMMRDVDLFVGVASVGNDPNWQDGGPDGRFHVYWHEYSFGELGATAQTRRVVLESLLPRLTKIRDRCSLSDRFLVVRGDLRTYKIHLGSGNILMEPNDQYLCIVPSRSTADGAADVFLPFEGDATLSIILSKAFLLAEDRKIKDETITRQIGR
jgi:hypothetical protein